MLLEQQLAECDSSPLTTGERRSLRIGRKATQCLHRLLELVNVIRALQ